MKKIICFSCILIMLLPHLTFASNVVGISEGSRSTGLELQADGTFKYYIKNEDDYVYNDWKKINGKSYYFDDDGIMATGVKEIDGEYYKFGVDGILIGKATELEWALDEGADTAEIAFNPLGETYKMYQDEYQDIINEAELVADQKAEEEEYKKWLKEVSNEELSDLKSTIRFQSGTMTAEQKAKVDKVIKEFKEKYIKDNMSDFEKEMLIIQYIVENNTYDYPSYYRHMQGKTKFNEPTYSAYGALINKTSVCSGYADAFQKMCEACGIETRVVSGATKLDGSGAHAWNMVKLGNDWYLVDTTWDDWDGYGFGNLQNKWINRTVDDFPDHYTYEFDEFEIYDDGTSGTEKNAVQKLDVPCHATTFGPKAIKEYLEKYN